MAKGKFDAEKKVPQKEFGNPFAIKDRPDTEGKFAAPRSGKLWPILAAVAGVAVLAVGILLVVKGIQKEASPTDPAETRGLSKAALLEQAQRIDTLLHRDLTLTLEPEAAPGSGSEAPIVITVPQDESGAGVDLLKLQTDLEAGTGKLKGDHYELDLLSYMTLQEDRLQNLAEDISRQYSSDYQDTQVTENPGAESPTPTRTEPEESEPSQSSETEAPESHPTALELTVGSVGRDLAAKDIVKVLESAYQEVFSSETSESLEPRLRYTVQFPERLDADALYAQYCKEPQDAYLDPDTGALHEGVAGYGFDLEALRQQLAQAKPGDKLRVELKPMEPAMDGEALMATLFQDVLGEAHTVHSAISNRTTNLKLACAAIDGTIVMPGKIFSFNKTVGERTEAKGYKEAIAYVSGGASKPEVGGGICQVASSIYYATLQADLKSVERSPHMYLVDYVPKGMDTTIYWGYLDYKFENNSPYPLKVEASVSDGKVHIVLRGTEWKDYTVELSSKVLDTTPWETVYQNVSSDSGYYNGEVISTPYTGYRVVTYKTLVDKQTNQKLETSEIAVSSYRKRDKVIAKVIYTPKPTQPTQPTQPPTEPPAPDPEPSEDESENSGG